MDENETKTIEVNTQKEFRECECGMHPFWKYLLVGLGVFLGTLCASYLVLDWHMKTLFSPFPQTGFILGHPNNMQNEFRKADKMFKESEKFIAKQSGIIHIEQNDDKYKIIIDLKNFDNNPNNISIRADKDTLNISAKSVEKTNSSEHIAHFQQSYVFGENVQLSNMTKTFKNNHIIIEIPIINNIDE